MKSSPRQFWQSFLVISAALSAAAIYQTEQQTQALLKIRSRYKWVLVMAVFAVNLSAGIYFLLRKEQSEDFWNRLELPSSGWLWKLAGTVLLIISIPALWYAKYDFFGKAVPSLFPLLWVWFWLALLQAAGIKILSRLSWMASFGLALLFGGVLFQSYFFLQPVTRYPFSLGWSEASRFYYGSLPFSKSIYGISLPLSVWHGTRYFLLSIPFLFGGTTLWMARFWQAFLWISLGGLTSLALVRRLKLQDLVMKILIGGWFALFLFQGAVYYHLLVCVIIIFAGISPRQKFGSLLAIILASFWAGMSRVNWFPVPAMLAIAIYLLEEPFDKNGKFWSYVQTPVLWGIAGLLFAFAGQFFYISISGNQDLSAFGSSFTSALLWYRWWPSDTNPLGVIPGIFLVSLPPLSLMIWSLRGKWTSLHPLRWAGLAAMTAILLGGGLVVSTKIGGGGDLHNMDAYIVLLGLITAYFINDRIGSESAPMPSGTVHHSLIHMNLLLIIPVVFSLSRVVPPVRYDQAQASHDLATLRNTVQSYSAKGPVLFIYERHLLTFGMIPKVPIVQDYEVITLTEMAISGNLPYLERFYSDLENHRFAAIVARKQNLDANAGDFAEESNVWNQSVAYQLLCEYEPVLTLDSSNIQVFVPRNAPECPQVTFK
ncbi:MAG: hypothetical protein K8S20_13295 [Chloroflexi bacterium]|nr:hypothetical protein [Chloroflexota bacterium]